MRTIRVSTDEAVPESTSDLHSCCYKIDKRMLMFAMQVIVSLGVSAFSIYMLTTEKDCCRSAPYMGLLSGIIGTWMPNPYQK